MEEGELDDISFEAGDSFSSPEGESGESGGELEADEDGEICEDRWREEQLNILRHLSDNEFNSEFRKAKEEADLDKLELILEVKEQRCKKLKEEVDREKEKDREERAKRQKLRELEEKFNRLSKTEVSLNKSLASSRNNSRHNSPTTTPRVSPRVRSTVARIKHSSARKERGKKSGAPKRKASHQPSSARDKKGEDPAFGFLLDPSKRNRDKFTELLSQAMDFADSNDARDSKNILEALKRNKVESLEKIEVIGDNRGEGGAARNLNFDHGNGFNTSREGVKGHNTSSLPTGASVKDAKGSDLQKVLLDVNSEEGQNKLREVLLKMQLVNSQEEEQRKRCGCNADGHGDQEADPGEHKSSNHKQEASKEKKLTSGRSTKPDDSDIKQQVKFAHEKLDAKHVKERVFDKLSFPTLIAGELELASQPGISKEEQRCRIGIAKTVAYHKLYLTDDELKTGYDAVLKLVETGTERWSDQLVERLNRHFEFRANVAWREKSTGSDKKSDKPEDPKPEDSEDGDVKIVYCMDFNKGICSFSKAHTGKWKGKKVTKWHVCRTCLKSNELNSHAERDCKLNKK